MSLNNPYIDWMLLDLRNHSLEYKMVAEDTPYRLEFRGVDHLRRELREMTDPAAGELKVSSLTEFRMVLVGSQLKNAEPYLRIYTDFSSNGTFLQESQISTGDEVKVKLPESDNNRENVRRE